MFPINQGHVQDGVVEDFQNKLFKEFPECDDLNHDPRRGISSFLPHLSLGNSPARGDGKFEV